MTEQEKCRPSKWPGALQKSTHRKLQTQEPPRTPSRTKHPQNNPSANNKPTLRCIVFKLQKTKDEGKSLTNELGMGSGVGTHRGTEHYRRLFPRNHAIKMEWSGIFSFERQLRFSGIMLIFQNPHLHIHILPVIFLTPKGQFLETCTLLLLLVW